MRSTISADVKAANSKLAQFLRRREEEEMILQIGKRKPKQLKEEKRMPGGRARWAAEPDFKVPTCMVDRPRTSTGATSFHFSFISVSKQAIPTIDGKPIEGAFGNLRQPALEHSKYIEREGAAEVAGGVMHANYIERPDVIESIDPSALIEEAIERTITSVINETPTDEEAAVLGLRDVVPDGIPSVFSNISDDPFERQEYWRAVERCERKPRIHSIVLDPETSPRWWRALEDTEQLDPDFKSHALDVAEKYRQYLDTAALNDEPKEPFKADPYRGPRVTAEQAGKLINQAMNMPGFDHSLPPLEFKSGRGGRIQIRFVAELPHEVTPEDRALIVQNFCDHIGGLETRIDPDGTERKIGMMYTAVIHAPDAHNDSRNYHLHIVAHDRPAIFLEDQGMWDFEVVEHFNLKGMDRVRYPIRQNKLDVVSQHESRTGKTNSGKDFIPAMRSEFAMISNAVLKARGIERRYDPRKYTEMGIDRTPTQHLGTKAAALEAIGVPTVVGQLNAIAIWDDAERAIEHQARRAENGYHTVQNQLGQLAAKVTAIVSKSLNLAELRRLMAERARLIEDLGEHRRAVMAFDHMEAKAKSRAVRTRRTCSQFLADIENGTADNTTGMMKFAIQARWKDAQAHIGSIDAALQPHRQALADAARDIERREKRVVEIDTALRPLQAALEHQLETASEQASLRSRMAAKPEANVPPSAPSILETTPADPSKTDGSEPTSSEVPAAGERDGMASVRKAELETGAAGNSASLKPVTIEGLPITKGTIEPAPADETEEKIEAAMEAPANGQEIDGAATPEGLEPLRPTPIPSSEPVVPETIIEDISAADQQRSVERAGITHGAGDRPSEVPTDAGDKQAKVGVQSSDNAADLPEPAAEPDPKIDRRRRVQEPALFDLPEQAPPVKPGTTRAEHKDWENLMNRIASERIPVKLETDKNGKPRYTVPSLSDEEQTLLRTKRFAHRTGGRLDGIYKHHLHEIKRLVRWVGEHGQNPSMLILENRTVKLGDVPNAVRTLMRNWGKHKDVIEAIKTEHNRRSEAVRMKVAPEASAPAQDDFSTGLTRREMLDEAAAKYPEPDQVYTREVAEFTRLLRKLAPKEELQRAADKIHASADAREDVNRHTVELATAYSQYVEGVDHRAAYREFRGQHVKD